MDIMVKTHDDEFSKKLLDFLKEHEAYLADDPVYADRMVWSAYDSHEIEEQVKLALEDDSYGINEFYSLQEITDMVMDEIDREIQNGQNLDHDMVIDNIDSTRSNLEQAAEALHDARDNMENKHMPPLRQAELLKAAPPELAEVLTLRQQLATSSVRQYQALEKTVSRMVSQAFSQDSQK